MTENSREQSHQVSIRLHIQLLITAYFFPFANTARYVALIVMFFSSVSFALSISKFTSAFPPALVADLHTKGDQLWEEQSSGSDTK